MIAIAWREWSTSSQWRLSQLQWYFKPASQCFSDTTFLHSSPEFLKPHLLYWHWYCHLLCGYCHQHAPLSVKQVVGWRWAPYQPCNTSWDPAGYLLFLNVLYIHSNSSVLSSQCLVANSLQGTVWNCFSFKKIINVWGPNCLREQSLPLNILPLANTFGTGLCSMQLLPEPLLLEAISIAF